MTRPISRTDQPVSTPQVAEDQQLRNMRELATTMWEDLRTRTEAIQQIKAFPKWDEAAIAASTKNPPLTRGLSARAEKLKEKLQGRFGINHPSEQIETFCENTLNQVLVWEKKLGNQLKRK